MRFSFHPPYPKALESVQSNEHIATKLTQEGILILTSEEDRSQLKNKEKVIKKCFKLLENALIIPKERKETKIPREVKEKRLNAKKVMSVLKQNRKKPNF
jgi:ribosome-associated protein